MSKSIVADSKPVPVNLEKGEEYHWCACGRSQNQPFCDGSHSDTGMYPMVVEITEETKVAWCGCKSKHAKLTFDFHFDVCRMPSSFTS